MTASRFPLPASRLTHQRPPAYLYVNVKQSKLPLHDPDLQHFRPRP